MESLDNTDWDVIISGTGLPQSLLALALSRSDKKILHVDQTSYYGGNEAALSLQDAEEWAEKHAGHKATQGSCGQAQIERYDDAAEEGHGTKLDSSRAYSLALAPQLLYARSELIPALVGSRMHEQLEFQAVGSFFILQSRPFQPPLSRVPSSREDIFGDSSIDMKSKRALMKFLRFVTSLSDEANAPGTATSATASSSAALSEEERAQSFPTFLQQRFGLPQNSSGPLLALTLSSDAPTNITTTNALLRLERHIRSIGVFGAGFGAVLPKWGGLAEVAQVACRACAVGGGVYCLSNGIDNVTSGDNDEIDVSLARGETVKTRWLVGGASDLGPTHTQLRPTPNSLRTYRSVSIVNSTLTPLLPVTAEGGATPAGAVIMVPGASDDEPPVHIILHSSESGECPSNQSVLYTSLQSSQTTKDHLTAFARMDTAVQALLQSACAQSEARVLWRMQWAQDAAPEPTSASEQDSGSVIVLPSLGPDLAFEDSILQAVKRAWLRIAGEDESAFLKFDARDNVGDDDG